jgi:chemosensory pili system protein ChpC
MSTRAQEPIHLLEIPVARLPLLVPSATVAEVINISPFSPLPFSPPWVLGVLGWRTHAIAVISFEALLAGPAPQPGPRSRIIVFYPLPGTREGDFFGILSVREPQTYVVADGSQLGQSPVGAVEAPFVAATVRLGEKTLLIPDLDGLRRTFYPSS